MFRNKVFEAPDVRLSIDIIQRASSRSYECRYQREWTFKSLMSRHIGVVIGHKSRVSETLQLYKTNVILYADFKNKISRIHHYFF